MEPPVRARTGCDGFARRADLRHARGDRVGLATPRAQPGAHDDSAVRQTRMAIGEGEIGRGKPALFAGARDDVRPVETRRDVAAIGAAVHHHGAADAAGNAGEEFQPGQSGRGGMFGDGHVERGGAGDHAVRFGTDRTEAAGQTDHDAGQSAVADDQIRAGADHVHRDVERQRAQELREVRFIRRPHQHVRGAADAEPGERRQRRVRLHASAQRRERVDEARASAICGHHHAALPAMRRPCSSASSPGSAAAHCVMFPAPRHTTKSPGLAIANTISASRAGDGSGTTLR